MAMEQFFSNLVSVMDRWVIVVSLLTAIYLLLNFRRFRQKTIAGSYLLVLTLFIFWSVRAIFMGPLARPPVVMWIMSFVLDVTVIFYAAWIVYYTEKTKNFQHVRKMLGLKRHGEKEPVVEYEGPELEEVRPGSIYLVIEQGFSYQWELFDALTTELPGLCFSRGHPSKIDMDVDGREIEYFWLSTMDLEKPYHTIDPFRRGEMEEIIEQFVEEHENPVILIDSVEYLFYKNSPEAVIDFIQHLHDVLANRHDVTLIYSIEEGAISEQHLALIQEEVEEVRRMKEGGHVDTKQF